MNRNMTTPHPLTYKRLFFHFLTIFGNLCKQKPPPLWLMARIFQQHDGRADTTLHLISVRLGLSCDIPPTATGMDWRNLDIGYRLFRHRPNFYYFFWSGHLNMMSLLLILLPSNLNVSRVLTPTKRLHVDSHDRDDSIDMEGLLSKKRSYF